MVGGEALVMGQECDGSPRCGRDWLSGEGAPVGGGGWVGSGRAGRGPGGPEACGVLVQGRELGTSRWEMVACLEGHDPRRRQGFGLRTEGPGLSSESIWGPLVSPAVICVLTPGRGWLSERDAIFHKTSQMFCFVGLLYLFIFKVVTTERRKQRKKKKRSKTGADMEEP